MANTTNRKVFTDHGYRNPGSGRGGKTKDCKASQVVNLRNPCKIATWNVKTLYQAGKVHNAIKEMNRLNIKILGISEMRWPGSGQCRIDEHQVYYSGTNTNAHQHGVGIIVHKNVEKHVKSFTPISERTLLLQINASPVPINIIQVYAPTADKTKEEVEEFYSEITNVYSRLPKHHLTVIMGDFNAKIGNGGEGEYVGPHGLGERNESGDRLAIFAADKKAAILNTFFKLPPRRLYTWRSPLDSKEHIVRNQIDYMLVNKRFQNAFTSVKTYPGADIMSDHNPLVGTLKLKLKAVKKTTKKDRYDMRKLKNPDTKEKVRHHLAEQLQETNINNDVKFELDRIKNIATSVSEKYLKSDQNIKRKTWMTDEILHMMEQRRLMKDTPAYSAIHKQIQRKIKDAKEKKLQEDCQEIEALQEKYDSFNMYKKVKETAGLIKPRTICKLTDKQGNLVIDKQDKIKVWSNYISELFKDARPQRPQIIDKSGPAITVDEVQSAVQQMKDGRAPGPDNFRSEILKLFDESGITQLTEMFNLIYEKGELPKDWLLSEFVIIPKKPGAKRCEDHRTISLMSHLLKLFLKIIHRRIYKKCEDYMSETQFGFRDAVGTREALFSVQVLFQRCRDVNCDVYACFVDYSKAFDRVQHHKLVEILNTVGIDGRDLEIISRLYWDQSAYVSVEGEKSDAIKIARGVRQGCVLSPLLFNVYSEYIFREALEDVDEGILLNGKRLNNIRYADDTVIMAGDLNGLQQLMNRVYSVSLEYGLDINVNKTKYMVISKSQIPQEHLTLNQLQIERVGKYTYLGTTLNDQWDHSQEIRCRIEKARAVFLKMASVFKSRSLTLTTKIRLLRCYVFSVLLYGVESWTLTDATTKKLESFEMWLYRRILRISWTDHVSNVEVCRKMQKDTELIKTIKIRKLEYFGHIMRNEKRFSLLQNILQGKIPSKRGPGRRRNSWLKNLRTWFSTTTTGLFRAAANKIIIARMIANIRTG